MNAAIRAGAAIGARAFIGRLRVADEYLNELVPDRLLA